MKTNTVTREIESNAHTTSFGIQASGKMFKMIISGLYSDKPRSITREIWSNAFDAHAMSGNEDKPFDVVFPTRMNPEFVCRDYGLGLSHDFMTTKYTVLGHSSKEDTNVAVGKWGVGRMSPLSYTDTFTIQSYHEGKVAYYSVTLGRDGEPQLLTMQEPTPTNEPSGLRISFPVRNSDIFLFQSAARKVASGFPVPPNYTNSDDVPIIKRTLEGKTFYFYEHSDLRGPLARMGCVLYPLNINYVPSDFRYKNIIVDMPIGSCEVTASREDLSYGPDDPTAESIKKAFKVVVAELAQVTQKEIDACDTFYSAYIKWMDSCYAASMIAKHPFTYKGQKLAHVKRVNYEDHGLSLCVANRDYRKNFGWTSEDAFTLDRGHSAGVQILIQHVGKDRDVRVVERAREEINKHKPFFWIKADLNEQQKEVDAFIKQFGSLAKPIYVRDLPDTGPKAKGKRVVKVKLWNTYNVQNYTDVTLSSEDFDDGGLYVVTANNIVLDENDNALENPLIFHYLSKLDERFGQFYRVPKTVRKEFDESDDWVNANAEFKKVYAKYKEEIKKGAFAYLLHECCGNQLGILLRRDIQNTIDGFRNLKEHMNPKLDKNLRPYDAYTLLSTIDPDESVKLTERAKAKASSIRNRYPMMAHCSLYTTEAQTAFIEYMKMVDAQRN